MMKCMAAIAAHVLNAWSCEYPIYDGGLREDL